MAIATSAVPVVKRALVDLLAADPAIVAEGLQVTYGQPDQTSMQLQGIIVGAGRGAPDWASIGMQERRERVTVRIVCHAHVKGADAAETEERGYEIAALVEQAVMADPTLDSLIEQPEGIAESEDTTGHLDRGYGCTVVLQFAGTARLTNT